MTDREQFEAKYPVPHFVEFDETTGYYKPSSLIQSHDIEPYRHYQGMWMGWQAKGAQTAEPVAWVCCGKPEIGAEYMGQQENICCGEYVPAEPMIKGGSTMTTAECAQARIAPQSPQEKT